MNVFFLLNEHYRIAYIPIFVIEEEFLITINIIRRF